MRDARCERLAFGAGARSTDGHELRHVAVPRISGVWLPLFMIGFGTAAGFAIRYLMTDASNAVGLSFARSVMPTGTSTPYAGTREAEAARVAIASLKRESRTNAV